MPEHLLRWLGELRRAGVEIAVLEGLPGAGKTTIMTALKQAFVRWWVIELDDFLQRPEDQGRAWSDIVLERGAGVALSKWSAEGVTLVEGAAAWPVVRSWMEGRDPAPRIARAYLKRVTRLGETIFWDDGEGLLEHAKQHERFFASIYEYHGRETPWLTADVVFERIDNDDGA